MTRVDIQDIAATSAGQPVEQLRPFQRLMRAYLAAYPHLAVSQPVVATPKAAGSQPRQPTS